MKRSEVNGIVEEAIHFFDSCDFKLPPFAVWSPDDWGIASSEVNERIERGLGWDVTDFGSNNYASVGLCLFTLRNGTREALEAGQGKTYAEKIMFVGENQVTPLHFHWRKTEDIINRGGASLVVRVSRSTSAGDLSDEPIEVSIDGRTVSAEPTTEITLRPGESISLPPLIYHTFWGVGGRVMAGEVSSVNDDSTDNRFHQPLGRFPVIEEDEPARWLLVGDYQRLQGSSG